ncbi:MAG: hypothetical protein LBI11_04605, partial [Streptococcaceae bacterium]|nr:hypothetical protein [Streptococcaceae bacterium]
MSSNKAQNLVSADKILKNIGEAKLGVAALKIAKVAAFVDKAGEAVSAVSKLDRVVRTVKTVDNIGKATLSLASKAKPVFEAVKETKVVRAGSRFMKAADRVDEFVNPMRYTEKFVTKISSGSKVISAGSFVAKAKDVKSALQESQSRVLDGLSELQSNLSNSPKLAFANAGEAHSVQRAANVIEHRPNEVQMNFNKMMGEKNATDLKNTGQVGKGSANLERYSDKAQNM